MYELILLTKSGREITVGTAENDEGAKGLSETAGQFLGSLKVATERQDVVVVNAAGAVYWLLPTEIEGLGLFKLDADGKPGASPLAFQFPTVNPEKPDK